MKLTRASNYAVQAVVAMAAQEDGFPVAAHLTAQEQGIPDRFLLKILLPASGPAMVGGLRYSLAIAWMTAVGAEMLMAENGMGNLLVGGGMWSSRLQTRSDPAVIIVGILALAAVGWAMDAGAKALGARLTRWARA